LCRASLEILERIPGIGLPTATAILSVCYPDEFVIIDSHMLEFFPFRLSDISAKDSLIEYLPRLKAQRDLWGCTLRDTDRALRGLSINNRLGEIIKNLSGAVKIPNQAVAVNRHRNQTQLL
jgi:hypothetical protein